jgi:hypothetical protein
VGKIEDSGRLPPGRNLAANSWISSAAQPNYAKDMDQIGTAGQVTLWLRPFWHFGFLIPRWKVHNVEFWRPRVPRHAGRPA